MRYRDLSKRLKHLGCEIGRHGKGSHVTWVNPATGGRTVIPDHGGQDIAPGTVRSILKQLGIDRDKFGPIK